MRAHFKLAGTIVAVFRSSVICAVLKFEMPIARVSFWASACSSDFHWAAFVAGFLDGMCSSVRSA